MKRNIFIIAILTVVAIMVSSCGNASNKEANSNPCELSGAGARVPEPYYLMSFDAYKTNTGNTIHYGDVGSKEGVRKLKNNAIDFAASDEYLTNKEMAKMKPVIHVPTCLIAVVFSYNIPEVKNLNLSGEVVADIYAGKITSWDDARIKTLNPTAKLPAKNITPIFRSDNCGMNAFLTTYLSEESDDWKSNYGVAKSVNFPVGRAADCNADVAAKLADTPYSIGYIGSEYAFVLKLQMAALQNASGEFIMPSVASISAAATGNLPADTRAMVIDSPVPEAYPISYFTWLIVYQEQNYNNRTEDQARATVDLLKFMLSDATQLSAQEIDYTPLPESMVENSLRNITKITYNGKRILE